MSKQPTLFDTRADRRPPRFSGAGYVPSRDDVRLRGQVRRIFNLMSDGWWRTLGEIEDITRDQPGSISAQLRHLRKERFGGHTVNKRHRGDAANGLYEYQLVVAKGTME